MKRIIHIVSAELFQISFATYLILLLLENIQKGFVNNFFNLNILLGVIVTGGMLKVVTGKKTMHIILDKIHENDWLYILALSIGGGMLVYVKTLELGTVSTIISFSAAIIILLLSYLIFSESMNKHRAGNPVGILQNFVPVHPHLLKILLTLDCIDRITLYYIVLYLLRYSQTPLQSRPV